MASSDLDMFVWKALTGIYEDNQWTYLGLAGYTDIVLVGEVSLEFIIQRLICM